MLRITLGIVVGVVVGFIAVMTAQLGVNFIYPAPRDVLNRELMMEFFRNMPTGHVALVLLTYLIGGFVGSMLARIISLRSGPAWVPAVLIALTAALNVLTYPHPVWAQIIAVAAPLLGCWLALKLAGPPPPPVYAVDEEQADAQI